MKPKFHKQLTRSRNFRYAEPDGTTSLSHSAIHIMTYTFLDIVLISGVTASYIVKQACIRIAFILILSFDLHPWFQSGNLS
jgi:hypothetical protein